MRKLVWPTRKKRSEHYFLMRGILVVVILIPLAYLAFRNAPWLTDHNKKHIESISLSLEVVAVILGGFAFADLYVSLEALKKITASLSTRHEQFPDSLHGITDMLDADDIAHVRIMVDFVDYGSYADPEWFDRYRAVLNRLARLSTKVEVLSHESQFARKTLIDRFKNFDKTTKYQEWLLKLKLEPNTTVEQFVDALQKREKLENEQLTENGIKLQHGKSPLPLFCWIRDEQQAVVCFPLHKMAPDIAPGHRLRGEELTFVTSDPNLVQGFAKLFDDLYKQAEEASENERPRKIG